MLEKQLQLLTARVRCCRFAKQAREFQEMEDEAFPTFPAGPPPGAMGDNQLRRQSGKGSRDEVEADDGSSVSTSACTSSAAEAAPEHARLPAAADDLSPAAPKLQDSSASPRRANAPFHRVYRCCNEQYISVLHARPWPGVLSSFYLWRCYRLWSRDILAG